MVLGVLLKSLALVEDLNGCGGWGSFHLILVNKLNEADILIGVN